MSHKSQGQFKFGLVRLDDIHLHHQTTIDHFLPGLGLQHPQCQRIGIGQGNKFRIAEVSLSDSTCRVAYSTSNCPAGQCGAGDPIDIPADAETVDDILVVKLIGEVFGIDKVAPNTLIGLPVVEDLDTGNRAFQVNTHQHIDRRAITHLLWRQIRRLEQITDQLRLRSLGILPVGPVNRRRAFFE